MNNKSLDLPFSWMGTKVKMRGVLLPLIEQFPRTLYVEPFCGAGGLFFGKPQERAEILNDSNKAIINVFRTLRNKDRAEEVCYLLKITPKSRSAYHELKPIVLDYMIGGEIKEKAREANLGDYSCETVAAFAFLYVQNCGFCGGGLRGSYGGGEKGKRSGDGLGKFNKKKTINDYIERLESVELENLDAFECIRKYDHEDTFFFIDPPYACSSSKRGYKSGWNVDSDRELVELLTRIKGSYVLTVYDTPDYRALLRDGARSFDVHKKTTLSSSCKNGQARVETVYFKSRRSVVYLESERPSLF